MKEMKTEISMLSKKNKQLFQSRKEFKELALNFKKNLIS